jgi:lipopolysaccharide/colanic/teichoic acid biosynthesis glycosyltransferase
VIYVVGSALALVILSPLMMLLGILIKLDSEGPVFYTQERMGLDGKRFLMLKFRSMRANAEDTTGPVWATANDSRRTRLGTTLRRFSVDELPQVINVLLGDMSLVGPRPERPIFVGSSSNRAFRATWIAIGRKGITTGAGQQPQRRHIHYRANWYVVYIENWSVALDLRFDPHRYEAVATAAPLVKRRRHIEDDEATRGLFASSPAARHFIVSRNKFFLFLTSYFYF